MILIKCGKCDGKGSEKPSRRYPLGRLCQSCYGTGLGYRWMQWLKLQLWVKFQYSNLIHADFQYADHNTFIYPNMPWDCRGCNGVGADPYGYYCESCGGSGLRWSWVAPVRSLWRRINARLREWKQNRAIQNNDVPF